MFKKSLIPVSLATNSLVLGVSFFVLFLFASGIRALYAEDFTTWGVFSDPVAYAAMFASGLGFASLALACLSRMWMIEPLLNPHQILDKISTTLLLGALISALVVVGLSFA